MDRFQGPIEVALSWNNRIGGLQMLTLPTTPETDTWIWHQANPLSLGEGLVVADIDTDGDKDLSLGTAWLRNDGTTWTAFTIYAPDSWHLCVSDWKVTPLDADEPKMIGRKQVGIVSKL